MKIYKTQHGYVGIYKKQGLHYQTPAFRSRSAVISYVLLELNLLSTNYLTL
jgi:hypothetical protein